MLVFETIYYGYWEKWWVMVRSAALWVCVCGIEIGIKYSNSSGINSAGITIFYTNLNSADADAKCRWMHHNKELSITIHSIGIQINLVS